MYNSAYHLDNITKKAVLSKDKKEARMMAGSSIALLDDTRHNMGRDARFYNGSLFIPQAFVQKSLAPFFKEEGEILFSSVRITADMPIKNIIIDPGHGGKDPGAIGRGGLREKDVVLNIAKRLKKVLNASGINVILTRSSDSFVSLAQRSKIANVKAADLFISLHANAAHSRWVSGVEVFYLSEAVDDNKRSVKAAKNYDLSVNEGYSGKDTEVILWDLLHTDGRVASSSLAKLISRALSKNLSQKNRGRKPARFYVLKETNIPAILVEVGFISNAREEKRLRDNSYCNKIALAISEGVITYNRDAAKKRTARQ
jgi:N-acetylmuramoyl-L-alanine amidase